MYSTVIVHQPILLVQFQKPKAMAVSSEEQKEEADGSVGSVYEYREQRELLEEESWQVFARNVEILASIIFIALNCVVVFFFFVPLMRAWVGQTRQTTFYIDPS